MTNNIRKEYSGGAVDTNLAAAITAVATTFSVDDGSTFPTGATYPFVISVDRDTSSEEKMLVTRSGNTFTVTTRGYDGTTAQIHADNATVSHVLDAFTIDQANYFANIMTTAGDLIYKLTTSTFARLGIGSTSKVLGVVAGLPAWTDLGVPAGTVRATVNTAADSGWLLFNQTVVNAQTLYPALWAVAPAAWKSGSSLVLPSMVDKTVGGAGTIAIGATGGANSKTIAQANLPNVTLTVDPAATTATIGASDPAVAYVNSGGTGYGLQITTVGTSSAGTITTNIASTTTSALGSGTALDVTPAQLAVTWQIKAH